MILTLYMTRQQYEKLLQHRGETGGMEGLIDHIRANVKKPELAGHNYAHAFLITYTMIERFARYRDDYGDGGWQTWMRGLKVSLEDTSRNTFRLWAWPDVRAKIYEGQPVQESLL